MAFIKISDPNIIDLAAWHQVINVVNQHSESITSITNTTGVSWNPSYEDDGGWKTVFDIGNQKIQYGKAKMTSTTNLNTSTTALKYMYEETVTFSTPFSATPMVTVTNTSSNTEGNTYASNIIATVSNISSTSFKIKIVTPTLEAFTGSWNIFINWVAIGPTS